MLRFLCIFLLLAGSGAKAQITYSFPDQRSVSLELSANAFSGSYANPSQTATQFETFHGSVSDSVSTSGEGGSATASGSVQQDSILAPTRIDSSSSATWSASFNSQYPQTAGANARANSSGEVVFFLDQYCRYTLTGHVAGNASASLAESGASDSGSYANLSVALGNANTYQVYGVAALDIHAGLNNPSGNDAKNATASGYIPAGRYALQNSLFAGAGVGMFNNASTQGSAETQVTLVVEPMGTKLVALEVTQTIQDWNQSVPLFVGKPTYVRAHVEPISAPSVPVMNPRLRGYVYGLGGAELPGSPLKPLANSASVIMPAAASDDRRENIQGSVNFQLPASWLNGHVRLVMEMDGLVGWTVPLEQDATFMPSPSLDLRMVSVTVRDGNTITSAPPARIAIQQELASLAEMYPMNRAALHDSVESLVVKGNAQLSAEQFLEQLKLKRLGKRSTAIDVAAVAGTLSGRFSGIADKIPGNLVAARIDDPGTLAHEVAHALGEFHPVNQPLFGTFVSVPPDNAYPSNQVFVAGPTCGGVTLAAPLGQAFDFPYWLLDLARIGPVTGDARQVVYGLGNASRPGAIRAISRYDVVDLMMGNYCGNHENWISTYTYNRLRAAMLSRASSLPRPTPASQPESVALGYAAIRGLVDFDANTVSLLPFVPLSLAEIPTAPTGSTHVLEVYCRDGGVTQLSQSISFAPEVPRNDTPGNVPSRGYFTVPVACATGVLQRVDIKRNGQVLASRSRSGAAPVIDLSVPNGGEVLSGAALPVTWTASDTDGDPLSFEIQFSPDGGQNWQTLAFDWTGTQFPLEHDSVPASTDARVRVIASDGVNTSSDESTASFSVRNHPPALVVASPTTGSFAGGDVALVFEALVDDVEDAALADSDITWSSSLDGYIGSGLRLERDAQAMSEGEHVINVSAVDSAGAIASASVILRISRTATQLQITAQPASQQVDAGQSATFAVTAEGVPVPDYQWQRSIDNGFSWSDLVDDAGHAGSHTATLAVLAAQAQQEGHRYRVRLENPSGMLFSSEAMLSVRVPEGAAQLSIADVAVVEGQAGSQVATVTVSLDKVLQQSVGFDIATADGSAIAGSDYAAIDLAGQSIPAGQASKSFDITIHGDTVVEPDESFLVKLANVTGAVVADGNATVSIVTDDAVLPSLSISDAYLLEGNAGAKAAIFVATLSSKAPPGGVHFDLATGSGRAIASLASPGVDYAATGPVALFIPEGQSSANFVVKILGDTRREPDEKFGVQASHVVGASLADGSAVGNIINDDALRLSSVQGDGLVSPMLGQQVVVQGIVTAVLDGGFFIQGADGEQDGNPATSEGLFVRASHGLMARNNVDPKRGQRVEVGGIVSEHAARPMALSRTELIADSLSVVSAQALPEPVLIDSQRMRKLPGIAGLERYEGMRVSVPALSVVGPAEGSIEAATGVVHANGVFHGVPAGMARTYVEPGRHVLDPSSAVVVDGTPVFDGNPERLRVDSAGQRGSQLLLADVGDRVNGLVGVLDDGHGAYGLLPDPDAVVRIVSGASPRPASVPTGDETTLGHLSLAEFPESMGNAQRSQPALDRGNDMLRLAKTVRVLCASLHSPAIVAMSGVGSRAVLPELAAASNARVDEIPFGERCDSGVRYRALTQDTGGDGVASGFLIDESEVRPGVPHVQMVSTQALGDGAMFRMADGRSQPLFGSPPILLQAKVHRKTGKSLDLSMVAVDLGDAVVRMLDGDVVDDSQARARRKAQIDYLAAWLDRRRVQLPFEKLVLLGDFGASEFSDGRSNLLARLSTTPRRDQRAASVAGPGPLLHNLTTDMPPAERYSIVREGNAQATSHILVSDTLAQGHRLRCEYARINADFGIDHADDYTLPLRISSSDPMLLYIGDR